MIELKANETKNLNVALTPIAVPTQIAIDQMFIGTRPPAKGSNSAVDGLYIRIKNNGAASVSGTLNIYDWQAWWEQAPGDDRLWKHPTFTIAPQKTFSYQCTFNHLVSDTTYVRAEVLVGDVIVAETPPVYIVPGKFYSGGERIAVGDCTYKAAGLSVLWYSQYSECTFWRGSYQTPETQPFLHYGSFNYSTYDNKAWPAVFLPIFDSKFIAGAQYKVYILGGSPGAAQRQCIFYFTAA
jgi:hypothetical protein